MPFAAFAQSQPVITSFTPSAGPAGTVITVVGSGFTGANYAGVSWASAGGITVVSDTQATITVPTGAPLGADGLVISNGTYAGYSATSFTVTSLVPQPVITSFTPSSGPVGTVITVTGSGFTGANYAGVSWASAGGITVVSDTQVTLTVPAGAPLGADGLVISNGTYAGYSATSFTVTSTGGDTTPPTTPTGVTASAVSSSQINLSWTASTDNVGVSDYIIQRCTGASCSDFADVGTSSTTSYSDTGLGASTSYSYQVQAADAAGNVSTYSNVASATTANGSNGYVYDTHGRLYSLTNFSGTMYYHYDAAGNLTSVTSSP